jgi:branched-chain amino acid transport system permease protein
MSGSTIISGLVTGTLLGGLFAITALGLTMVFGVMRLVNVVHGELLILAAYVNYTIVKWLGFDPLLTMFLVIPIMFAVGWLIQSSVMNPIMSKGEEAPLLSAFGLQIILQNLFLLIWKADTRTLTTDYTSRGINILGIQIPIIYLIQFALALALISAIHLFMSRSYLGKAMRAAALDPRTAEVLGINRRAVYSFTYGLGAAITALGGTLIGMTFSFVPTSGLTWLLKGFVVVVLGGIGSIGGTLGAGFILGAAEGLGGAFVGTGYRDMIGLIIFLIVLIIRPNGLFGRSHD